MRIERATRAHAEALAPTMRAEDAEECRAATGHTPLEALVASVEASSDSWAVFFDGELVACFGVAPFSILGDAGAAWMLGGESLRRYPKTFWRVSLRVVGVLLKRYAVMFNFVDARYAQALRWASRLGFQVREPMPFGPAGMPFCPIVIRRKHV